MAKSKTKKEKENKQQLTGWVCPVCGRGNSPFTMTCLCYKTDIDIRTDGETWGKT